jgi:hypothetical protein
MKWKLTYLVGSKAVESWVLNSQSLAYWKKMDLLATGNYEQGKFKVEQI